MTSHVRLLILIFGFEPLGSRARAGALGGKVDVGRRGRHPGLHRWSARSLPRRRELTLAD